jgi:hypothetical protein
VIELNRKQKIIDQEPSGDSNQEPNNQKSVKIKRLIII